MHPIDAHQIATLRMQEAHRRAAQHRLTRTLRLRRWARLRRPTPTPAPGAVRPA